MALAPLKKCTQPGCRQLIRGTSRCDKHKKQKHKRTTSASYQHLYDRHWRNAARRYKAEHPLCVECLKQGKVTAVYCVDHIVPHKGDKQLFNDRSNWQSLCEACHNSKTARGQ